MSSIPSELIYVLAIAAFAFIQYLLKRFGGRTKQGDEASVESVEEHYDDVTKVPAASTPYVVNVEHFGRAEVLNLPVAQTHDRFLRTSVLGTRQDIRKAIILATLLGPCRAREPYESR